MLLNPGMTLLQRQRNHTELFDLVYSSPSTESHLAWFLFHFVPFVAATPPQFPLKCSLLLSFVQIVNNSHCHMPTPKKPTNLRHPESTQRPGVLVEELPQQWQINQQSHAKRLRAQLCNSVSGSRGRPVARALLPLLRDEGQGSCNLTLGPFGTKH